VGGTSSFTSGIAASVGWRATTRMSFRYFPGWPKRRFSPPVGQNHGGRTLRASTKRKDGNATPHLRGNVIARDVTLVKHSARTSLSWRPSRPAKGLDSVWGHHASCSCKIGEESGNGVLDSNFKAHGVTGPCVVDASIFPRIPGFFIVSSIYIAAEKAADVIHASLKSGI
jgi:choline dehydrogenase-like flavoprotein